MLKSKIHRATVTDCDLHYVGSITIDPDLLEAADILEYEQVHVVDVDNGARFETYTIPGERGSGVGRWRLRTLLRCGAIARAAERAGDQGGVTIRRSARHRLQGFAGVRDGFGPEIPTIKTTWSQWRKLHPETGPGQV